MLFRSARSSTRLVPPLVIARQLTRWCSDDSYQLLKEALLDRVHDKEATVRMQAVVALAKLQGADADSGDSSSSDDDESDAESNPSSTDSTQKVSHVLVDVLTHDPAACVCSALSTPPLCLPTADPPDTSLAKCAVRLCSTSSPRLRLCRRS